MEKIQNKINDFTFYVQNSASTGILPMQIKITQKDFPTIIKDINLAIKKETQEDVKNRNFHLMVNVEAGENAVKIIAYDNENNKSEKEVKVTKIKEESQTWAAVIGVGAYQKVRPLQYTVPDAEERYTQINVLLSPINF